MIGKLDKIKFGEGVRETEGDDQHLNHVSISWVSKNVLLANARGSLIPKRVSIALQCSIKQTEN